MSADSDSSASRHAAGLVPDELVGLLLITASGLLLFLGAVAISAARANKGKGKNSGKTKKAPKNVKAGRRPHELRQAQDALKRPE